MLVCRVVRFYLARLIIDSNRCLLIRYEHGCISHMSSLVISMKQRMRLGYGKNDTIDDDGDQVIDDTSSNVASDNDIPTCSLNLFSSHLLKHR